MLAVTIVCEGRPGMWLWPCHTESQVDDKGDLRLGFERAPASHCGSSLDFISSSFVRPVQPTQLVVI